MFDPMLAEWSLSTWLSTWVLGQVVESSLLLVIVALVWWCIRHRAAPQFGYWLFLLVLIKLMLPLPVPCPGWLAKYSPHSMTRQWLPSDAPPAPKAVNSNVDERSASFETSSKSSDSADGEARRSPTDHRAPPSIHQEASQVAGSEQAFDQLGVARQEKLNQAELATHTAKDAARWMDNVPKFDMLFLASWVIVSLALLTIFCVRHLRFGLRLRHASPIAQGEMRLDWRELCQASGLRGCPSLVELSGVSSPAVFGLVRPVVILPYGFCERLQSHELAWCLLHELAHIRRGDLWVSLFQRFTAIVFWFHPAVWFANRCVDQLREYACDEQATHRSRQSAIESSSAFLSVLKATFQQPTSQPKLMLGVFGWMDRRECLLRIQRMLESEEKRPLSKWTQWPILILIVGAFLPQLRAVEEGDLPAESFEAELAFREETRTTEAAEDNRIELSVVGEDGKPIPGLSMQLATSESISDEHIEVGEKVELAGRRLRVRANGEGRIVLAMPKDLVYFAIFIESPGYAPYWCEWRSQSGHAPPPKHTIELDDGWIMGGVLTDEEGSPIANAIVHPSIAFKRRSLDQTELHIGTEVTTDAEGRWSYGCAPASRANVTVSVRHASFQPTVLSIDRAKYEIRSDSKPTVKDILNRGLAVTGRVVDSQGKPVVGALIRGRFVNDERSAVSQEDGSYRLEGCLPGMTRLVASAKKFATDMKPVEIVKDSTTCDFILQPGGHVRIRVMDEEGNPLPRARIFFQEWRGRFEYWEFDHVNQYADQDGVWEWNEAPLDEFKADICGPNGMLSHQPVMAREDEYVFVPPSGLTVSGKVRDAVTGMPIQEFRVIPGRRGPNGFEHWERGDALDGKAGSYTIKIQSNSDERSAIRIEADGYLPKDSRDIQNDEGRATLNLILNPAKTLDLRVFTPDGQNANDAKLAIGGPDSQFRVASGELQRSDRVDLQVADRDGRCRLTLPGESFHILVTHAFGYALVHSSSGQDLTEIRLMPWGEIQGQFRRANASVTDAVVSLQQFQTLEHPQAMIEHTSYGRTDQQGSIRFEKVIPGSARVAQLPNRDSSGVELPGQSWASQSVEVHKDQPTKVTVGGEGRTVTGKLKESSGRKRISMTIETPENPVPKIPEEISRDPEKAAQWWNAWMETEAGKAWNTRNDQNNRLMELSSYYSATIDEQGLFRIDGVAPGRYKAEVLSMDSMKENLGTLASEVSPFLGHFMIDVPAGTKVDPIDLGVVELKPNQ